MTKRRVHALADRWLRPCRFDHLDKTVIDLNNLGELKKVFGWKLDPILDDDSIYQVEFVEDANERRIRDAECLGAVVRNTSPSVCLDIGTSTGHSAAMMAVNAPTAKVYTVNIPPEEIVSGEGGTFTTIALEREKIGAYYRERELKNITQILANTKTWDFNIGTVDVALVDGCHDAEFVFKDTRNILARAKPGTFILWHDFHPGLVRRHEWIRTVCHGVEKLYARGLLNGQIFHVRDSWTGVYRVR